MSGWKKEIANNLRVYRAKAGITQEELSMQSGVSVDAIGSYERETSTPLLETACKLAAALGCTVNDLCGFSSCV